MQIKCPRCGQVQPIDISFCANCGLARPVTNTPTQSMADSILKPFTDWFTALGLLHQSLLIGGIIVFLTLFLGGIIIVGKKEKEAKLLAQANAPTATPATPATPATVAAYKSNGLGLDRATWESSHGKALEDGTSFLRYENDKFAVMFSASKSGNASHIERVYGDRNAVAIADARVESKSLIPADAKFVRTYTSRSDSTIDLYTSESLKSRFSESDFIGGKAGDFIVLYRNQTGKVTTFITAIGNNP